MAQAAANLYRELVKVQQATGRVPFAANTDCAYFASDVPDALAACPAPFQIGTGLRHVKVNANGAPLAPIAAILDQLAPGFTAGAHAKRIIDDEIQPALRRAREGVTDGPDSPDSTDGAQIGASIEEEA